jgi:amino acid transporter
MCVASATQSSHEQPLLTAARPDPRAPTKLRLMAVVSIIFFNVSGGPLGSEQVVSSCGPIIGITLLCVFALCFSVPQAMITAELSTAFPYNGGYSLWVQAAFGTFWGVQESYYSWFSGVVDTALYPVLLYAAAQQLLSGLGYNTGLVPNNGTTCINNSTAADDDDDDDDEPGARNLWLCMFEPQSGCALEYGIKLGILVFFCLPNLISSKVVGDFLTLLCAFALAPFFVLCAVGLPKMSMGNLMREPPQYDWGTLLSTLYWSMTGFDCASTIAGEVERPGKTIPRALFLGVAMVGLATGGPLLIAAAADPGWNCWKDGSLVTAATVVGGSWLGAWMLGTSILSNWGLFASELLEDSYQLLGMAEMGLAPRFFASVSPRTGTPINAILFQFVIIAVLISLDFNSIMCIDNFFSAAQGVLEFAAIVRLRIKRPEMARPYKIPLSTAGLALFLIVPICWSLLICYVTVTDSVQSAATISIGLLLGLILYFPFLSWDTRTLDFARLTQQASLVDATTHRGNTHSPLFGPLLDSPRLKPTDPTLQGTSTSSDRDTHDDTMTDYVLEPGPEETPTHV